MRGAITAVAIERETGAPARVITQIQPPSYFQPSQVSASQTTALTMPPTAGASRMP